MNSIILKNADGLITEKYILTHLKETLNAQVGDSLKCTILNQAHCRGEIAKLSDDECVLNLHDFKDYTSPWINLIVGISRPQTTKKILEHATTFGAGKMHFYRASLSEKSYLTSKVFDQAEMSSHLLAGLSQSGIYGQMPEVLLDMHNPALSYNNCNQKFILDLNGAKSFLDYHQKEEINFSEPIHLAIGPERGFISKDIEYFKEAGFKSVKISSSVLRVEHAIYSAISQLEMLRGQY